MKTCWCGRDLKHRGPHDKTKTPPVSVTPASFKSPRAAARTSVSRAAALLRKDAERLEKSAEKVLGRMKPLKAKLATIQAERSRLLDAANLIDGSSSPKPVQLAGPARPYVPEAHGAEAPAPPAETPKAPPPPLAAVALEALTKIVDGEAGVGVGVNRLQVDLERRKLQVGTGAIARALDSLCHTDPPTLYILKPGFYALRHGARRGESVRRLSRGHALAPYPVRLWTGRTVAGACPGEREVSTQLLSRTAGSARRHHRGAETQARRQIGPLRAIPTQGAPGWVAGSHTPPRGGFESRPCTPMLFGPAWPYQSLTPMEVPHA